MTRFRAFLMSESPEYSSGWTQTGPPAAACAMVAHSTSAATLGCQFHIS